MSLDSQWFENGAQRAQERAARGVTPAEAARCLAHYDSENDPVAVEMAEWIRAHWTPAQVQALDPAARAILDRIPPARERCSSGIESSGGSQG